MEGTITQETGTAQAVEAGDQPKPTKPQPTKKAAVAKKGAHGAPKEAKATLIGPRLQGNPAAVSMLRGKAFSDNQWTEIVCHSK